MKLTVFLDIAQLLHILIRCFNLLPVNHFNRIRGDSELLDTRFLTIKIFDEAKNQRKGQSRRMEGELTGHHSEIVAFTKKERKLEILYNFTTGILYLVPKDS